MTADVGTTPGRADAGATPRSADAPDLAALRAEVMRAVDRRPSATFAARHLGLSYGQLLLTLALVPWLAQGPFGALLAIVLVGIAQYHLYFPLHEACHGALLADPGWNRLVGRATAGILGSSYTTFTAIHMDHHRHYGTERDTGSNDYWVHFRGTGEMLRFFGLPLLGALDRVRLNLWQPLMRALGRETPGSGRPADAFRPPRVPWQDGAAVVAAQAVVFALLTGFGARPLDYLWFWIVPVFTVFMALARLRMYLEHGPLDYAVSDYLGPAPRRIARTHGSRGPVFPISAMHFRYHWEHHLVPSLPSHRLPEVHHRFTREFLPADDWSPGYAASLARLARLPGTGPPG